MTFNAEPQINSDEIIRELLRSTQNTHPPTNVELIAKYLNLSIMRYENGRDFHLSKDIRAFLDPRTRLIGIDKRLSEKQARFSILHEVGHFVLPGHATHPALISANNFIEDSSQDLSVDSTVQLEIEANQFAADALFQLEHFDVYISQKELSWDNIKLASKEYHTSFEATARRWIEKTPISAALVVFAPRNRKEPASPLQLKYTITSANFKTKYFHRLVDMELDFSSPIFDHFYSYSDYVETEKLAISTAGGDTHTFTASLFGNTYREFALITP